MSSGRISSNFSIPAGVLILLGCLLSGHVLGLGVDAEIGMRHEQNLGRAERQADQEHDTALVLNAHAEQQFRLDPLTRISVEGGLGTRRWTRFDDLSEYSAELGVRARRALNHSFEAPWAELSLKAIGLQHQDSDIRDGGILRAGATGGRRFGHRFDARLGYAYQIRRAAEDRIFDLEHHEMFGQLDVQLGRRWLVYLEVGVIEGELVSTAGIPNPRFARAAKILPRGDDDAFGLGPSPLGSGLSPRWTYQIEGVVLNGEIGINYPLRPGLAIDVAARYVQAYASGDIEYDGYTVNAGLLWQFGR